VSGKKNIAKLVKKTVVDKEGHHRTVWVRPNKAEKKHRSQVIDELRKAPEFKGYKKASRKEYTKWNNEKEIRRILNNTVAKKGQILTMQKTTKKNGKVRVSVIPKEGAFDLKMLIERNYKGIPATEDHTGIDLSTVRIHVLSLTMLISRIATGRGKIVVSLFRKNKNRSEK